MNFLKISLLTVALAVQASRIEFFNIDETQSFIDNNLSYHIDASYKLIDLNSIRKNNRFYNRKKVIKDFDYTKDGTFCFKEFCLKFFKHYRVNNYLYFDRVHFKLNKKEVYAKECVIPLNNIKFISCKKTRFYSKNGDIIGSRVTYILPLQ